jgi:serine/threonine protein phosphatase 1
MTMLGRLVRSTRSVLDAVSGHPQEPHSVSANRLRFAEQPVAVYAIGDIHGRVDLFRLMEERIVDDAKSIHGEKWIICLGDMVDRGPSSAAVLDRATIALPLGFKRFCLMGNHEAMMLAFLDRPDTRSPWLDLGGRETLRSYGVAPEQLDPSRMLDRKRIRQVVAAYVPEEHRSFLESLPVLIETPKAVFVHAGLKPGTAIERQSIDDMLMFRDGFRSDFQEFGKKVVHGHTRTSNALLTEFRASVDTGAYETGTLSAVRILDTGESDLMSVSL